MSNYVSSPLNYVGNKFKLLDDIIPLIPEDTTKIIEVFAGSAMVSINTNIKDVVLNDISSHAISLLQYFYNNTYEDIVLNTESIIEKYGFTNTYKNGYSIYPTTKNEGLSRYNKTPYIELRTDYNKEPTVDKLFVLVLFGFNHFLRFNSKGDFNVPVGKVDFSQKAREKTKLFIEKIKEKNICFSNIDFNTHSLYEKTDEKTFFYFDPPYLITEAPYNSIWTEEKEKELLKRIDSINENGQKFILSNVLENNGKENIILKNWSKKYNTVILDKDYSTASYQRKNNGKTIEVIIKNY